MKQNFFFVLGAKDPEMERIIQVLEEYSISWTQALYQGVPVTPATANKADGLAGPVMDGAKVALVECRVSGVTPDVVVDHHAPGDPGYGLPPERYMEGSSLGQVLSLLGKDPTELDRIVAAADHCLSAAYQGLCPDVDPAALRRWRTQSRAAFQKVTPEEIERRVESAIARLDGLPSREILGVRVFDATGCDPIPELPEAVAIRGALVEYAMPDKATGRTKVGLLGSASPEVFRAWMDEASQRLTDVYGDPSRGFAGGYLPENASDRPRQSCRG